MKAFCIAISALSLVLGACASQAARSEPTITSPPPTVAASDTPVPSDTPAPTDTPVPTDTPTPEPTATPTEDLAATQAAAQTQSYAAALALIKPELERIGIPDDEGSLAWSQAEPVSIDVDAYNMLSYSVLDPDLVASDFVLHSEFTWDSTGGFAICGIIMRAAKDTEQGEQYRFQTIRLSGWPRWDIERYEFGRWLSTASNLVVNSRSINQENGASNRYTIIARGSTFTVYVNDDKPKNVVESSLKEGRFAFMTWQESGETACTFENTWIWSLEQ